MISFLAVNCGGPGTYPFAEPIKSDNGTEYGAIAALKCQDGYWFYGSYEKYATLECGADGLWRPNPGSVLCVRKYVSFVVGIGKRESYSRIWFRWFFVFYTGFFACPQEPTSMFCLIF